MRRCENKIFVVQNMQILKKTSATLTGIEEHLAVLFFA